MKTSISQHRNIWNRETRKGVFDFLLKIGVFIFPKEEMKPNIFQYKNIWSREIRKGFFDFLLKIGLFIFLKEEMRASKKQ